MKNNYCPICGTKLIGKEIGDEGIVPFCEACSRPIFNYYSTCVILIVENEDHEIAIIEQSYGFRKPVLVAGYVKYEATIEDTIRDEVSEEINQEVIDFTFLKSFLQKTRENLMLGFHVNVKKKPFVLSDELLTAKWCSYQEALDLLKDSTIALELLKLYLERK